ncbi:protein FAM168A isoform X2 [Oxyura jamaicensis]|uniref:protein FAM168A isoform X2 n=1 Tax=Oxyura jamaicensis TaxID=8884 RepID=UPI0015A528EE|nr:protein FAM168A isoform X2 [Oxyura jamaicensis]
MNPVYSPVQPGAPYGNPKNMAYTGYPTGYPTAAPAYNPNMYPTSSPGYAPATLLMKQAWPQTSSSCATEGTFHLPVDTGTENRTYQASSAAFRYTAGTPYKVPPTQSNNAPPPYSPSPNPYQTAMYPIRSAYPQQNLYTQVRASLLASGPGQLRILQGRRRGRRGRPRGMEGLGWAERWDQHGDTPGSGVCSPRITPLGVGSVPQKAHPWLCALNEPG